MYAGSMSFLSSISTLIKNECFLCKMKIRCFKLRNWINVFTLVFEKTLKQSLIFEKLDEKETQELKNF